MSVANVVDSSGWREDFADSERAPLFAPANKDAEENDALQVAGAMQASRVVDLRVVLALKAARHLLPFADSIICAAAMRHQATCWTQDEHFKDLPAVRFCLKHPTP